MRISLRIGSAIGAIRASDAPEGLPIHASGFS
jgi:hypothetical protein